MPVQVMGHPEPDFCVLKTWSDVLRHIFFVLRHGQAILFQLEYDNELFILHILHY